MVKNISDNLSRVLNESAHSDRNDIWLWLHLITHNVQLPATEIYSPGMRQLMADALAIDPNLVEHLKNIRHSQLLPEESFRWMNEGKRQIEWLHSKITFFVGAQGFIPPTGLSGKDLLIARIDLWNVDTTQKGLVLKDLHSRWNEHIRGDKYFTWFSDNEDKCALASDWMSKHADPFMANYLPFDTFEGLLIFFDKASYIHEQKLFHVDKIKKRWSQQKYRQNMSGKAQCNFILSERAIERLNKLATTYDLSRAQILEILLQMESEKKLYISEKIKVIKAINSD